MTTDKKTLGRHRRHNRVRARLSGTADVPRLVVFRSNTNMSVQVIDDVTGKTLFGATTINGSKGTKVEQAVVLGKKIAELAKGQKVDAVVFDRNGYQYHGRVKALAEAAREGGLRF
jgi:large subunit ribosomal protein L18